MRTRIPPSVTAGLAAISAGVWLALVHQAAGLTLASGPSPAFTAVRDVLIGFPLAFGLAFAGARLARSRQLPVARDGDRGRRRGRRGARRPGASPDSRARRGGFGSAARSRSPVTPPWRSRSRFPSRSSRVAAVAASVADYSCAWERRARSSRAWLPSPVPRRGVGELVGFVRPVPPSGTSTSSPSTSTSRSTASATTTRTGKMYVLRRPHPAVRAAGAVARGVDRRARATTRSSRWSIRANEGDCVDDLLRRTRPAGGDYGMHIDGLEFAAHLVGRRGRQERADRRRRRAAVAHVPLLRARPTTRSRARTTCTPARATAPPSRTACSAR